MYVFALFVILLAIVLLCVGLYTRLIGFFVAGTIGVLIAAGIQLFATSGTLVHW